MKIKAIIHEAEEGGYWAEIPAIPGCAKGESSKSFLPTLMRPSKPVFPLQLEGSAGHTSTMHPRTAKLFEHLDHHRATLRRTVDEIPPELRRRRPAPERWSVVEILDHLGLVERRLTYLFNQWLTEARERGLPAGEETSPTPTMNLEVVLDRSRQIVAGEAVLPRAELDDAAAWAALEEARRDLKAVVLTGDGLSLGGLIRPHPALGPLNFYQWVEFVGWHEARHTAQIREAGSPERMV